MLEFPSIFLFHNSIRKVKSITSIVFNMYVCLVLQQVENGPKSGWLFWYIVNVYKIGRYISFVVNNTIFSRESSCAFYVNLYFM